MNQTKYKRIILKISGEILDAEEGELIHAKSLENICKEIKAVADMGVEIGLVVGGVIFSGDCREGQGHRPNYRRFHGNACHSHQWTRINGSA